MELFWIYKKYNHSLNMFSEKGLKKQYWEKSWEGLYLHPPRSYSKSSWRRASRLGKWSINLFWIQFQYLWIRTFVSYLYSLHVSFNVNLGSKGQTWNNFIKIVYSFILFVTQWHDVHGKTLIVCYWIWFLSTRYVLKRGRLTKIEISDIKKELSITKIWKMMCHMLGIHETLILPVFTGSNRIKFRIW